MLPEGNKLINAEIDGHFPQPPSGSLATQKHAAAHRRSARCGDYDLGIAFDGDGDRIGAVDRKGRVLFGDQLMILFARDVLTTNPGATIIADVKASGALFDDIAKNGGVPLMWKTGHSLVKAKMKETKALLAGEMSGHIFFADRYFGYDDGIYSAIRLINLLEHADKSLDQMIDELPEAFNTPEIRIDTTEEHKFQLVEEIRARMTAQGREYFRRRWRTRQQRRWLVAGSRLQHPTRRNRPRRRQRRRFVTTPQNHHPRTAKRQRHR